MKIAIVAATGRIGRLALEQALAAGHEVTAVVRNPSKLPPEVRDRVASVAADLTAADPVALAPAFAGVDGVLSCLGPTARKDFGVAEPSTRAVVEAMRLAGAKRLVIVSAAPVSTTPSPGRPNPPRRDPGESWFTSRVALPIVVALFKENYVDLARAEDRLRDSGLDWTSVRPPRLLDRPFTGRYRTAVDRSAGGATVSRADVADCMLRALERPEWIGHGVGVSN